MDVQTLCQTLQLALSTNTEERKAAEARLEQYKFVPGHIASLLQAALAPQLEISIRQVASINLKNLVNREWEPKEPEGSADNVTPVSKLPAEDRAFIRDHIIEAVVQAPPQIRRQLGECTKTVVRMDFPEHWPNLLQTVDANLRAQDPSRAYAALLALRLLSRKYEFKDEEDRIPMHAIIANMFPLLLNMLQALLAVPNPTPEIAELIKLVCKTFWSATYLEIPPLLREHTTFSAWMVAFHTLLSMPVPTEGQPVDLEARQQWVWWKCKKWTLHIVNRLFNRYGDPRKSQPEHKEFATWFHKEFSGRFLELYLSNMAALRSGAYLPDRVVNLTLQFITSSISRPSVYKLLKPQLDVMLFDIVFPLLCFNDRDAELWQDDPHEYVRKGHDIIEDMFSPRTAAVNFLLELIRSKGKTWLVRFLGHVVGIFQRYAAASNEQKPYREKDGAFFSVGSLADRLKRSSTYRNQLEAMIVQHVLPEFENPLGHMRSKACWMAGNFADIKFTDARNFSALLHRVMACLHDPDLPVRVDAVVALRSLVDACDDLSELRPILPQLLDAFFRLMDEVENEDLVFTLETIVDKFGEEIAPYALGLVQNLATVFFRCIRTEESGEDADDTGALAAVGCLRAISTLLESVSSLPQLYPQLEDMLMPIMTKMLTTDGQDVYEEVLEIVSYITYFSPTISPGMWGLWPLMADALDEWALDYFENILVPLDNYISRGTEVFLTSTDPDYLQSTYKIVSKVLGDTQITDSDASPAPKLMEVVLQNGRGKGLLDQWIEPYLRLVTLRLRTAEKHSFKDYLMLVVADALYYNPQLAMSALQHIGVTGEVFQAWLAMLYKLNSANKPKHFKREHDKKVCSLGLTSVMMLPVETLPVEVQQGLPELMKAVLKLLADLKVQMAESQKAKEEEDAENGADEEEDDDDDFEPEDNENENDDEVEDIGPIKSKHLRFLDEDEAESDSDSDFTDDEEFSTPLDDLDAFIFFSDTMKVVSTQDPNKTQALTRGLDFSHQAMLNGLLQHAEVRRQEIAVQKAKEASKQS
eukprot:jgi/Chlat1/5360/Chrsp35S05283